MSPKTAIASLTLLSLTACSGGQVVASALEPFESVEGEKVAYAFTGDSDPRIRPAR